MNKKFAFLFFIFDQIILESESTPESLKKDSLLDFIDELNNENFIQSFRMKKSCFYELLKFLGEKNLRIKKLQNKLLVFIYFISHITSYRRLKILFNISKSTIERYVKEMSFIFENLSYEFVKFPHESEYQELSNGYMSKGNFQGTILTIDGPKF